MTPSRERGLAALLCAAGAGLTLTAAGRTWATVSARAAITPFSQEVTGRELDTAPGALGLAALAGLAALLATRGRVRAGIGLLLAVFGAAIGYASAVAVRRADVLAAAGDKSALLRMEGTVAIDAAPWWIVSLAGGVLLVAAGLLTLLRGARWPGMSARYERTSGAGDTRATARPGAAPAPRAGDPSGLWKSLDRGEDPTAAEERRS